jgi:hypothetical protein
LHLLFFRPVLCVCHFAVQLLQFILIRQHFKYIELFQNRFRKLLPLVSHLCSFTMILTRIQIICDPFGSVVILPGADWVIDLIDCRDNNDFSSFQSDGLPQ